VVIPTLNEAENLPHVLPQIPAVAWEVLLVDGRSTDGTVEVARRLRPDIRVVRQKGRGKGDALRAGFAAARGDIIVMLDADGSTDPREIPAYVGALMAGADFAKGTRFAQGGGTADMSQHRRMGNWVFATMVKLFFGGAYSDLCYGYNAFWRHVLPALDLDCDGFEIETQMNIRALRAGLRVAEVPSFEAERINGEGRLQTFPDGWRVLKTIFKEAWSAATGGDRHRDKQVEDRQPIAPFTFHSLAILALDPPQLETVPGRDPFKIRLGDPAKTDGDRNGGHNSSCTDGGRSR
jgi:glycosyltransferase involved in cell wall biosynthesis